MPTVTSGPSTYGNLLFFGWPLVAFCLAVITGSLIWAVGITVVGSGVLVVAHELVIQRTSLVPVTEADVRASRRSAFVFASVLVAVAAVLLAVRQYNAM